MLITYIFCGLHLHVSNNIYLMIRHAN